MLLYVSAVFGYIGIVLLLWMYALGAKSIFGLVFRDISSITHIHRWLGKYGLLFILAHPILITLSYSEGLFYSLVPHISSEFERHVTLGRISLYLVIMLWVSSVLLRKKMGYTVRGNICIFLPTLPCHLVCCTCQAQGHNLQMIPS
jgi:predicted ferric reductase